MEIQANIMQGIAVLALKGSIDAATAPQVSEVVQGQIANQHINLVVDMSGVEYTSSAGLRVLLSAVKETRAQGGDLRLAGVQPDVMKVLNLSGFTNILKTFAEVNAAVASYS